MKSKIIIKKAQFQCNVGITEQERSKKQEIIIDIDMFCNIKKSTQTDNIKDTIDYFKVHAGIKKIIENKQYNLLETIANKIADYILENYNIKKISILIQKPNAFKKVEYAGIRIEKNKK